MPTSITTGLRILLLALLVCGCGPKIQGAGQRFAAGALDSTSARLNTAEMQDTIAALSRAAAIGAMSGLTDDERKLALRGVAEDLITGLTPQLRAALHDELGPELREQVVTAVHAALIELTSRKNQARIEEIAAGVTGAVVGRLGPDLATAIRLDIGPAVGDVLQDDIGPVVVALSSQVTDTALDRLAASLEGPLGDRIDEVLNRGEDAALQWRTTFIVTAILLGCLMLGSGVWLRNVYRNLHKLSVEKVNQEQALSLVTGAIKQHESSDETRAIVATVKAISKDTPGGEVIRELLVKQPHLKVQGAPVSPPPGHAPGAP